MEAALAEAPDLRGHGAGRTVSRGIMRALERRQLAAGQRLVETDLAAQFGVGRNAVREAIQWLSAHGAIDVTRHRSPAIRQLDPAETQEVLDVAAPIMGLMARAAARRYRPEAHGVSLHAALQALKAADEDDTPGAFSQARRRFYRLLIEIGANRELKRVFPAIGMHVLYAQYPSGRLRRFSDFQAIAEAITAGDAEAAEAAGRAQIEAVRASVLSLE